LPAHRSVRTVITVVFALSLVCIMGYLLLMVRPYMTDSALEMRSLAELMAQLPPEVGTEEPQTHKTTLC
jgi:hypothetical protein